jgi:hypothetical protein
MAKSARELSIEELATAYGLSKANTKSAIQYASRDTLQWGNKESAKGLANELDLPYPTIRKRMRLKVSESRGRLWYGFNTLDLKFANPTQSGDGVNAAGKHYSGAFILPFAEGRVFRRNGRLGVMSSGRYKGKTRERIEKIKMPIDAESNAYLGKFVDQARAYFIDRLIKHLSDQAANSQGRIRLDYNGATLDIAKSLAPRINP